MKDTKTFVAKSGNVAIVEVKGSRGFVEAVDVDWHKPPSRKDMRECDEWYASQRPNSGVLGIQVEDASERRAILDEVLYGGQRQ